MPNDTEQAMQVALDEIPFRWGIMQTCCPHRNADRDEEGQGKICENEENDSGMGWCDIGHCPLLLTRMNN